MVFSMDATLKNLAMWIVAGLAIGLVGGVIYTALMQPHAVQPQQYPANQSVNPSPQPATPSPTPNTPSAQQNIAMILINADACPDCNSTATLAVQVQQFLNMSLNISVNAPRVLSSSSADGQGLIAKYNITKLPVLIITGNLSDQSFLTQWSPSIGTVESDGVLVSRSIYPPYYDLPSGTVVGKVTGIAILPSNCEKCVNGSQYLASLEGGSFAVFFSNKTILNENDAQAQSLIAKFNVTELPTVILDSGITAYPFYAQQILPVGTYQDGWYVLREVHPPYLELPSNSVRGLVDVAYLKNSSCANCTNITQIGDSLAQMIGISINSTTEYEIGSAEGAALAKKYSITKIPTVLYSPELSRYPQVSTWWTSQNNTIESDGWFVFRTVDQLNQTYQNISS